MVLFLETGWLTPYRNGKMTDAVFDAYKYYLVCCMYKIVCLLIGGNLLHTTGIKLHINPLLLECIHVVFTQRQVHEVKYSELVNSGATETELQEQLVGGDMTIITMRIPRNLKEAGAEAAALRGISFSAFIRMYMIEELVKRD